MFSKKLGQKKATPARAGGQVLRDTTKQPRKLSLQEKMLADAEAAARAGVGGESEQKSLAVNIRNIVTADRQEPIVSPALALGDSDSSSAHKSGSSTLIHEID